MKKAMTLEQSNTSNLQIWILAIGIILIGSNLRAPLTGVGPLIDAIRGDLEMSNTMAGAITTLPLLAFAFLSPFAPKIANRFSMERTILYSLILLAIGITVRSLNGFAPLFLGTLLIGLAIAIGNVLIPGFIKLKFPFRIGVMTGLYAVFMNLFGALASGLSVPLSGIRGFGWQGALGSWAVLAVIAILIWIPQLRRQTETPKANLSAGAKQKSIWRSPLAWQVTIFMGAQSLIFYTLMTWLPEILVLNGYSSNTAGWTLFLMQFAIIPVTFIIPVLAGKMKNQIFLSGLTAFLFFAGVCGLLFGSTASLTFWVMVVGVGSGSCFSLSMMFFTLRTKDSQQAAELSGMAQSFGYLLAATGPVFFGGLHDLTHGWTVPLSMLLVVAAVIFIVGIRAGRDRLIEE